MYLTNVQNNVFCQPPCSKTPKLSSMFQAFSPQIFPQDAKIPGKILTVPFHYIFLGTSLLMSSSVLQLFYWGIKNFFIINFQLQLETQNAFLPFQNRLRGRTSEQNTAGYHLLGQFYKNKALDSKIFKILCNDMGNSFETFVILKELAGIKSNIFCDVVVVSNVLPNRFSL